MAFSVSESVFPPAPLNLADIWRQVQLNKSQNFRTEGGQRMAEEGAFCIAVCFFLTVCLVNPVKLAVAP